jgi:ABC-type lipoprotein release transport system permease subunit
MSPLLLAVGTAVTILALIGLVVGLVVLVVVISLLQGVLTPLRRILADVQSAQTAPMLERGVQGTDQLGRTRRLAESVPDLAAAYLVKLGLPVNTEAPANTFPDPGPPPGRGGWR